MWNVSVLDLNVSRRNEKSAHTTAHISKFRLIIVDDFGERIICDFLFFCIEIENTINKFFYFSKKLADIEYVLEFINRVLRYINILIFYINVITLSNVTNRMKYKGFNINTLKYIYII